MTLGEESDTMYSVQHMSSCKNIMAIICSIKMTGLNVRH